MSARISRSPGIMVGGLNPGGGYEGKTKELDASVASDAKWLAKHFPRFKVEIRFNSDRRSGGAFLNDGGGYLGNDQLGINTRLAGEDGSLSHSVVAIKPILRDASLVDDEGVSGLYLYSARFGSANPHFSTNAEARRWVLKNVVASKIVKHKHPVRPPGADLRRE